ncbi:Protein RTF1 homolog [Linum perenne]
MADLEHLLLEAAGRTGKAGRKPNSRQSSRRRDDKGSDSEGGSDSRDDDSDNERGYGSRKRSKPLKKRVDTGENDDEQGRQGGKGGEDGGSDHERGGSSDESEVGSDLYKDEEDRRHLEQMSELEREMILTERADKKGDKNLTERIRSKRENERTPRSRKQSPPLPSSRGVRSSARYADKASAKDDVLNELRAKRLRQQDPEAHRKLRDSSSRGASGSHGVITTQARPKRFTSAASLSSSSHSDSDSRSQSDDDGSTGDGGMADSDDEREQGPTYEDIREITIRRSKLAKWLMEPWFDDLIVGCFVRVGIGRSRSSGPVYRLCLVKNIDAADPDRQYRLENKTTYKWLNVTWGNESSAARWQMAMVSESGPTEDEYRQWKKEVENSNGRMPSKEDVMEKKEAIKKSNSYVYSAATVKQMLQEKKSASTRPLNVAAEKERLRREIEVAESRNNMAEVERIRTRIRELEASRQALEVDKKKLKLAEMNRKNRVENFKNASEIRPVNTGLKAGEAGYDPFSRRWTRSRNYYAAQNGGGDAAAAANGGDAIATETTAAGGEAATEAALRAAAGAGKLVDTMAPVDQETGLNRLHDFELPISLDALESFGYSKGAQAGYMARKQRIEATMGVRVPENDGRRHALTLTVSDYKRRRGLL